MSENEITYVHELLAKYTAILQFAHSSHCHRFDKTTSDAINAIKPVFDGLRDAIDKFEKCIDAAVDQLKRHVDMDTFEAFCNEYEKMLECDVVKKIIEVVHPNDGGNDGK